MTTLHKNHFWSKILLLLIVIGSMVFIESCKTEDTVLSPNTMPTTGIDYSKLPVPATLIEVLEKEQGVTYFKKDVTLKDEKGTSIVIMRIASLSKVELDKVIDNYELSIFPSYANDFKKENEVKESSAINATTQTEQKITQNVIFEPISIKLAEGVQTYGTNIKPNKAFVEKMKSSKVDASNWNAAWSFTGHNWAGAAELKVFKNPNGTANSVEYRIECKDNMYAIIGCY
jgi:hypothetical protein